MRKVLPYQNAICYSGFRDGQSPETGVFPSYNQIKEDLLILQPHWESLRLYDCDKHSQTVLDVIRKEDLPFNVMLGAYIVAEVNNKECPWGGEYDEDVLENNKKLNQKRINTLIEWANKYPNIISSVSAGNEATVSWTDHLVPTESVLNYVSQIKSAIKQPISFCENYVPWLDKLKPLGEAVDFISIHTYPVWEYKTIGEALSYTKENYNAVANTYPDKQIVITEAGWATKSNGRGIEPHNVNEELQQEYVQQLMAWAQEDGILIYLFEAFDENWKGSDDALEPEKHWGLFTTDRTPKRVMATPLLV
ncbi:MAG: exo-beta-1,3-glucanase (GH17 family) [Salibacteraceae bacterium]|jgi:exo-beta-1,3-glucanase (GH17 family)